MNKNKIPKIIHYCWFGEKDIPEKQLQYIKNWEKLLPEFTFMLWNENNMDITNSQFAREAYQHKKYAFLSDYVRIFALYNYGGIYLDTDVEMLKPLNELLKHDAFIGNESDNILGTSTIGAAQGNIWIKEILDHYEKSIFVNPDGSFNMTPNPVVITNITKEKFGWDEGDSYQVLPDNLHTYPFEYFCAKNGSYHNLTITENTYTVHHFAASWYTKKQKNKAKLIKMLGPELIKKLSIFKSKIKKALK